MKRWNDHKDFSAFRPVVTTGIFDGVHKGHRFLLDKVVRKAAELEGESVVVTFQPHPRIVLSSDPGGLRFLTSLEEKTLLLEKTGLDHLVVIPFTRELALSTACDFIRDILVHSLKIHHLLVGFNHHFGRGGTGGFETIEACSGTYRFGVEKQEALEAGAKPVSSSRIRMLLGEGSVREAAELLGYEYFLQGSIGVGKKFGRTIGFPTANITPDYYHKMIPAQGVYAVLLCFDNQLLPGMLNIGHRPTVNNGAEGQTIEAHLFDFHQDIYNKPVSLMFIERMRPEMKFGNVEELKAQLHRDREQARQILSGYRIKKQK